MIGGEYAVKPSSYPAVGGNEGCGVVDKVGASTSIGLLGRWQQDFKRQEGPSGQPG